MKVKITLFYVFSILICFLLQTSVFEFLQLNDVMPNILLILTVSFALIRGKKSGVLMGFVCGILIDIFSGDVVGQYALLYVLIGYANGFFHAHFYDDSALMPIGMLVANSFIYSLIIFFFFFALRGRLNILAYLTTVMIPEAIYTGVIALPIFLILTNINSAIETSRQRSNY